MPVQAGGGGTVSPFAPKLKGVTLPRTACIMLVLKGYTVPIARLARLTSVSSIFVNRALFEINNPFLRMDKLDPAIVKGEESRLQCDVPAYP